MRSKLVTLGKGRWQRQEWQHTAESGIEKTILKLLDSIEDLEHGYYMDTCDGLNDGWDYYLSIQEEKAELHAILA